MTVMREKSTTIMTLSIVTNMSKMEVSGGRAHVRDNPPLILMGDLPDGYRKAEHATPTAMVMTTTTFTIFMKPVDLCRSVPTPPLRYEDFFSSRKIFPQIYMPNNYDIVTC